MTFGHSQKIEARLLLCLSCVFSICQTSSNVLAQDQISELRMFTRGLARDRSAISSAQINPLEDKAVKLNQQGVELYFKGQQKRALGKIKQALAHDPQNTEILYNLSGFYLAEGEPKMAVPVIHHAVRKRPDDVSYLSRLAESYVAANEIVQAIAVYERIAKKQPNNGEVLFRLGTLYALEKRLDSAENTLIRSKKLLGEDPRLLRNLGNILIAKGKYEEALLVLTKALDKQPIAENAIAVGIARESLGHYQAAIESYKHGVTLGEEEPALEKHISELEELVE